MFIRDLDLDDLSNDEFLQFIECIIHYYMVNYNNYIITYDVNKKDFKTKI